MPAAYARRYVLALALLALAVILIVAARAGLHHAVAGFYYHGGQKA